MGHWQVSTETLGSCRFALSPLVETVATLGILTEIRPEPWRRSWLAAHQPALHAHLADAPQLADWLATRRAATWPTELRLPPPDPDADPQQLDLTGLPLPPALAELLDWTWQHTVRPDWPARLRTLRADIAARRQRAELHGWPAALPRLGSQHHWLTGGRLHLTAPDLPAADLGNAQLLFVPTSARHGWLTWDAPTRVAVVYPTSAAPVPTPRTPPASLGRLLGSARAELLAGLDHPRDTAQLATLTGLSQAAVGDHLTVLLDARLVARARSGTAARYYRTALAEALLSAQPA